MYVDVRYCAVEIIYICVVVLANRYIRYVFVKLFHLVLLTCRLISEKTIEENILKKANQKRMLGDVAIEGGNFTTAFFKQVGSFSVYRSRFSQCSHKSKVARFF